MIIFLLWITIGLIEYSRLSEDFRERLRTDFPMHSHQLIEISLVIVLIFFGLPLLTMKTLLKIKSFTLNVWRKITFPLRLWRFRVKLNKANSEKDSKKSVKMLFEAMSDIMK